MSKGLPLRAAEGQLAGAGARQGRAAKGGAPAKAGRLDGAPQSAGYPHLGSRGPIDFDDVKARVPLLAVLARYRLDHLKRSGKRLIGPCPLHGGTNRRQFVVSEKHNRFTCFSCGQSGSAIDFVMAMEKIGAREAARLIADWFTLPSASSPQARRLPMAMKPTHKVLAVVNYGEGENVKSRYREVGVAFPIKNGKGLTLYLDAVPTNGKLLVLERSDEDEARRETTSES